MFRGNLFVGRLFAGRLFGPEASRANYYGGVHEKWRAIEEARRKDREKDRRRRRADGGEIARRVESASLEIARQVVPEIIQPPPAVQEAAPPPAALEIFTVKAAPQKPKVDTIEDIEMLALAIALAEDDDL